MKEKIKRLQEELDELNNDLGLNNTNGNILINTSILANRLGVTRRVINDITNKEFTNEAIKSKSWFKKEQNVETVIFPFGENLPFGENPDNYIKLTVFLLPNKEVRKLLMFLPNSPKTIPLKHKVGDLLNNLIELLQTLTSDNLVIDDNMTIISIKEILTSKGIK